MADVLFDNYGMISPNRELAFQNRSLVLMETSWCQTRCEKGTVTLSSSRMNLGLEIPIVADDEVANEVLSLGRILCWGLDIETEQ